MRTCRHGRAEPSFALTFLTGAFLTGSYRRKILLSI